MKHWVKKRTLPVHLINEMTFSSADYEKIRPQNGNFVVSRFQNVDQIAGAIIKAIKDSSGAAAVIAPKLKKPSKIETLKLIFLFTKNLFPYKKEPGAFQSAKTLPRIISDADHVGGDCKHYSTTIAALCLALNIPVKLRLISQKLLSQNPTHIYAVATVNGKDYIIDPCLKNFNQEARYYYKKDIKL